MERRKFCAVLGAASLMWISSWAFAADVDPDNAKLQGTWKATSVVTDGKQFEKPETIFFTFDGEKFELKSETRTLKGTFTLDSSKTPKHLNQYFNDDNGAVLESKAIYKIEGDTLTICDHRRPSQGRPFEFESTEGSGRTLITLKKVTARE
ncbi:MAG: TIGR03067 domain-containing protein [Phycisphaera sp.]|nr:TIGR03067 domain-containing protein [Phycisphaera sp.]